MASPAHTTRRHLFAIAGAATLAGIPALTAASISPTHIQRLEARWHYLNAAANQRGLSDSEVDAISDALVPLELEIAEAPCDSREAFMAKLRTVVRNGAINGQVTAIDDEALIDGMIRFMEGAH